MVGRSSVSTRRGVALVSLVLVAFAWIVGGACDSSDSQEAAGGQDATGSDMANSDTAKACSEWRQLGDMLDVDDTCWAPPGNYCSAGAGGAVTRACLPGTATCCDFGTTCVPCGWTTCEGVGCPTTGSCDAVPEECRDTESAWSDVCEQPEYLATMDPVCIDAVE